MRLCSENIMWYRLKNMRDDFTFIEVSLGFDTNFKEI